MWPKVAKTLATFLGHPVGCIDRMPVFNLATFVLYVVNSFGVLYWSFIQNEQSQNKVVFEDGGCPRPSYETYSYLQI